MPNRMIRDDLLDSERVLGLPVEARWLFVTVMLSSDDLGLFEATEFKLARRADVRREHASKLLQLLADADLVRLYRHQGKAYGFVPRFRQRIQIKRSKHPLPPLALMADDPDALKKINDLAFRTTDAQQRDSSDADAGQQSEAEAEAEAEAEKEKPPPAPMGPPGVVATGAYRPPPCPSAELVELYHRHLPELPAVEVLNEARKRALAARWREVCVDGKLDRQGGLDWFAWFFARVAKSRFLTGRMPPRPGGRDWRASFDFLVRPMSFAKVVEGAYA